MKSMKIIKLDQVNSTMDYAKKLARGGAPEWTVVTANKQTAGRGQFKRKWISPPGGLYFSVVFRPKLPAAHLPKLTLLGVMSIAQTLNKLYKLPVKIKWPNDVLVNNRKIAGVLVESEIEGERVKWVVLGAGINVNTDIFDLKRAVRIPCTSLKNELNKTIPEGKLLKEILSEMKKHYKLINKACS